MSVVRPSAFEGKSILVTGATGLVGGALVPQLISRGGTVRILSRSPGSDTPERQRFVWDGVDPGSDSLRGADAIVHLAGESIFGGLPTSARRKRIRDSRIDSTRMIVERCLALAPHDRPKVFVCASAVGYYGDRGEEWLDESSAAGSGFLAEVCRDWEARATGLTEAGVRVVRVRIGVVLSKQGGALAMMKTPFALGVGGRLGSGEQFFPWIHLDDLVETFLWALDSDVEGAVNAVAPEQVRNRDLTRELGRALRRPTFLPVPAFALKLALGELAGELLGSRRVRPSALEHADFAYQHETLASALEAELD